MLGDRWSHSHGSILTEICASCLLNMGSDYLSLSVDLFYCLRLLKKKKRVSIWISWTSWSMIASISLMRVLTKFLNSKSWKLRCLTLWNGSADQLQRGRRERDYSTPKRMWVWSFKRNDILSHVFEFKFLIKWNEYSWVVLDYPDWYEVGKWRCEYAGIYLRADYSSFPTSRDGNNFLFPVSARFGYLNYNPFSKPLFVCLCLNFSLNISSFFQVERVANMLNYFLLQLVGPQRKSLSLKDPEKYEFRPKQLLKQVGIKFITLCTCCIFWKWKQIICRYAPSRLTG